MARKSVNHQNILFDDEIAKKLMAAIPIKPKAWQPLAKLLSRYDMTKPQTFIAQAEREFEKLSQSLPLDEIQEFGNKVASLFFDALSDNQVMLRKTVTSLICFIEKAAFADPKASLILKLMHEADEKIPHVSLLVVHEYLAPQKTFVGLSKVGDYLRKAEAAMGEEKAQITLDALEKIAEHIYKPYLQSLINLTYFKEGKKPSVIPKFGGLVATARQRVSIYPGLIEPDAGWMRNSAAHSNFEYLPDEQALLMWDDKVPATKISVDDLFNKVHEMAVISGLTMPRVAQLYLFRETLRDSGLLDVFIKSMKAGLNVDAAMIQSIEKEVSEKIAPQFQSLEKFVQ